MHMYSNSQHRVPHVPYPDTLNMRKSYKPKRSLLIDISPSEVFRILKIHFSDIWAMTKLE